MTEEKFWKIADKYEREGDDGQPYIPKSNIRPAVKEVAIENNYEFNKALADVELLFNFKLPEEALTYLRNICKRNDLYENN